MVEKQTVRGRERRWLPTSGLRLIPRDGGMPGIEGYAAVFNQKSADMGFREIVLPGAFDRAIANDSDVRGLVDHLSPMVLGRTKSRTLQLGVDDHGLKINIPKLPDTTYGRDLVVKMEREDVDGMSFSFDTRSDRWHTEDGEEVRELIDVDLFDVSVVTYPAYPQTDVALRSLKAYQETSQPESTREKRGEALGSALSDAVDGMVTDDLSRADIIQQLADAAGIEPSTVNQILTGAIQCPPVDRISAFAGVLGISISSLSDAAVQDGCDPDLYRSSRTDESSIDHSSQAMRRRRLDLAERG